MAENEYIRLHHFNYIVLKEQFHKERTPLGKSKNLPKDTLIRVTNYAEPRLIGAPISGPDPAFL
jgi:hypothetical protein